jgi:polyisoprenoid-binding protein YceI
MTIAHRRWSMAGLACALAATGIARAEPATFRVAPEVTSVRFAVSQLGIATQEGRFERAQGTIVLDAGMNAGSIDFTVDAASVNTGWNLRDAFLKSAVMFDVARYPAIRFHSTRLVFDGARLVAVDGDITLHGVSRPVRFDVTNVECGPGPAEGRAGCGAHATGRVSRRAFGMSFAYPLVGDEVALVFAVTGIRIGDDVEAERR